MATPQLLLQEDFRHNFGFQAKRRECDAVYARQRAVLSDGVAVAGSGVAHVALETVVSVPPAAIFHHAVAHHLGDDRGGGD